MTATLNAQRAITVSTPKAVSPAAPLLDLDDQRVHDTQHSPVVGGDSATNRPAKRCPAPKLVTPDGWLQLRMWSEMFDDAQKARIANKNRVGSGGINPDIFAAHIAALETTEHTCRLMMRRTYRKVVPDPIREWVDKSTGVGVDMMARILGHLGDPVIATPQHWEGTGAKRVLVDGEPFNRTVGQLWQYCGHGAPGRKWKGMSADDLAAQGSPKLKMLVHLCAENAIKEPGRSVEALLDGEQFPDECNWPYRGVYEVSRLATIDKAHTVECVRCGPSGKPAQPGSPWSPGHQHAHALRIVGKEILRDLWSVAA